MLSLQPCVSACTLCRCPGGGCGHTESHDGVVLQAAGRGEGVALCQPPSAAAGAAATLPARLLHASIAAARRYIQTARYVPALAYSIAAKALQRRDDARVSCLIDSVLGLHGTIAGLLSVCLFHFTVPYRLSPKTMMMHSHSQSGPTPSHSSSTLQALGQSGCRTDRANGHGDGWHAAAARGVSVLGWLPVFAPQ